MFVDTNWFERWIYSGRLVRYVHWWFFCGETSNISSFLDAGNNDSWLEVYKLPKDQWKTEMNNQEQVFIVCCCWFWKNFQFEILGKHNEWKSNGRKSHKSNYRCHTDANSRSIYSTIFTFQSESSKTKSRYSIEFLWFSEWFERSTRFSGSNNFQQLMKNTENQTNIGQGITNHFYTQQVIDAKTLLIRELVAPIPKNDGVERPFVAPRPETSSPMFVENFSKETKKTEWSIRFL